MDTGFTDVVQVPALLAQELDLASLAATETQYPDGRIDTTPSRGENHLGVHDP